MSARTITVDGQEFVLSEYTAQRGASERIRLMKAHHLLDHYARTAPRVEGGNMVEVGLWDGGSTAYFALLFKPRKLIGFELEPLPLDNLTRFVRQRGLEEVVHVHLGVDQSDRATILDAISSHIGDEPLDIVVDDASHLLAPTTATFEFLFPRLRPGGTYFIEDWSNEHFIADRLRAAIEANTVDGDALVATDAEKGEPDPLSRLILDLVLLAATGNDMIESIDIRRGLVEIRRGPSSIDPDSFSVRRAIGDFGRRVAPRPGDGQSDPSATATT